MMIILRKSDKEISLHHDNLEGNAVAILVLISGSNNSGKSIYAEQLIAKTIGKRYYIATMRPCTEDNHRRIKRHRAQRQGLGFDTIESPYQVGNAPVSSDGVVLLEDVSNLLANAMFEKGGSSDSVFRDICTLADRCRILVVVTIAGLKDDGYDAETVAYINGLNEINQKLFDKASVAISMQEGTPVYQKGDVHVLI